MNGGGEGFTEWRNVTKARPRFPGHYQPHLPADLGFYDLRIPEVREKQALLAEKYGIYGFCYYHYWFNGKILMERPLRELGKPNFPFMICWANENWTRAWDGGEKQIIMEQKYNDEDSRRHILWLLPYLKDPRYIRIDNKPVIAIYRSTKIPDVKKMLSIWREEAHKENLDLYICRFESFGECGSELLSDGFDAAIDFQPHNKQSYQRYKQIIPRMINKISRSLIGKNITPILLDYGKYVEYRISQPNPKYKIYPCITPRWDNSPRRKNSFFAFTNSSPDKYQRWLQSIIAKFRPYSSQENLIFINAWNEWAEGNHLEPDLKYGNQYLIATLRAIENSNM